MDVTAHVQGRDLAAVAADIEARVGQVSFPLEYRAELLGEYAVRQAAQRRVLAVSIAVAIGIFLLLQAFSKNWSLAALVFLSMPAALAGAVLAILLTGGGLVSFGSMVGLITVLGLAVRNAILLISNYRRLERRGKVFGEWLVADGTEQRAPQILMSAITTALVFLPFVLFGNVAGLEIARPMAIAVFGGLITSTLVSLVGIPAICVMCGAAVAEPDMELVDDVMVDVVTA
jgi:Cu/Ag efflux pump CusA